MERCIVHQEQLGLLVDNSVIYYKLDQQTTADDRSRFDPNNNGRSQSVAY